MSMLKSFFSYDCDPQFFDGLAISEEKELCEKYMGKFPVISITLKSVEAVDQVRYDPDADPEAFWMNSSGNAIIRTLLQKATDQTMSDLDQLANGLSVTKKIAEELTYRELYDNIDNLWSVLFATGYLTRRKKTAPGTYELAIPNQEIRMIFTEQILSWFQENARKDAPTLGAFCDAFSAKDPDTIEKLFTAYLKKTINIRDTAVRKEKKKTFTTGFSWGF